VPLGADPHRALHAQLVALLDQQRELFGTLDGLSQRQAQIIADDDPDRLLELLTERQAIIDAIGGVNERIAPLKDAWRQAGVAVAPALRDDIASKIGVVAALADAIARRDTADQELLRRRRDAVSGQLTKMVQQRQATGAYSAPAPAGPRIQDFKG
jgi:hypothetical protein